MNSFTCFNCCFYKSIHVLPDNIQQTICKATMVSLSLHKKFSKNTNCARGQLRIEAKIQISMQFRAVLLFLIAHKVLSYVPLAHLISQKMFKFQHWILTRDFFSNCNEAILNSIYQSAGMLTKKRRATDQWVLERLYKNKKKKNNKCHKSVTLQFNWENKP